MADSGTSAGAWAPTRALGRAILVTGVLILLAVMLGRIDLVVLAAPFALGTAWALRRRPVGGLGVELELPAEPGLEGGSVDVTVRMANPTPVGFDLAVVRLDHSSWVQVPAADRPYATVLEPSQTTELALPGTALRWGYQDIGPVTGYAVSADGLLIGEPVITPRAYAMVLPQMPSFRADEVMPRASALVGVHRSRRPGEGGELAGVRRYAPGDRLRRIDWRVTLRTRELHVAQTLSDRDAEVVLLLDVLHEAGESGGIHGAASVLDTTVRAAAALAEYYLRQGDRVSLLEYSRHLRLLRPASGRRHLQTILDWLLQTKVSVGAGDPMMFAIDPRLVPHSALVIVLTPLLAGATAEMIATMARAGRVVVAVDTLGELARMRLTGSQWTDIAQRLWRMEREHTIGQLREVGVPVITWGGAGSLDQVLRDMTRMAAAPRISMR